MILAPFESGLSIEVAKNLILAGVKEIVLLDDGDVSEFSLAAGFVWREEDVGRKVSSGGDRGKFVLERKLSTAISQPHSE